MNTNPQNAAAKSYNGFYACAGQTLSLFLAAVYPNHHGRPGVQDSAVYRKELAEGLLQLVRFERDDAAQVTDTVLSQIDEIRAVLDQDAQAAYINDPAATGVDEVILLYPAFKAICAYRLSHALYVCGAKLCARAVTEVAHRETNTDIHPGATIGKGFFIDHGGVLIGETATVGDDCVLFNNVVLGVKKFPLDENGNPLKGAKRHPDIGNRVTIYTGACVLGGETKVGDGAVIGAQVWLTHSVGENEVVTKKSLAKKAEETKG